MNTQLVISLNKAIELYPTASPELKVILEESFGKNNLQLDITERVCYLKDACKELGISYKNLLISLSGLSTDTYAYECLKIITKVLNEGWVANWEDGNQKKWFPWFRMSSLGFEFHAAYRVSSFPAAGDTSRLLFKDEKTAIYAGTQFLNLYKDYIL